MAKAAMESLSVRVPSAEKAVFKATALRNGTDPAAAVRAFVHAFNMEGGYPFDTAHYYPLDEEEEAEVAALKAQFRAGILRGHASHRELREGRDT
jgi:antitoxin component of RelBE/YafQ-DinJ toxin-antitoxin module